MITVPDGMSCVNAFRALWESAKKARHLKGLGDQSCQVDTAEKVADLFRQKLYFQWEGGRNLYVSFHSFPQIDVREYDDLNGKSAKVILEKYAKRLSEERFDAGDAYQFEAIKLTRAPEEKEFCPSNRSISHKVNNPGNFV